MREQQQQVKEAQRTKVLIAARWASDFVAVWLGHDNGLSSQVERKDNGWAQKRLQVFSLPEHLQVAVLQALVRSLGLLYLLSRRDPEADSRADMLCMHVEFYLEGHLGTLNKQHRASGAKGVSMNEWVVLHKFHCRAQECIVFSISEGGFCSTRPGPNILESYL
eukprot:1150138-Pelagomonas_calceolata.AAC.5